MSSINLACFKKPSRYIGNEVNIIRKDAKVKVALCFPDTYEIGMSHLGLKILYSIINNIPYASAERVFAPWVDMVAYLKQNGLPLVSLENKRPLKDFDIVGFTLQYELSYTNILNMLELGRIPVTSADRGNNYPLIIAGGPCAVNPLPLAPFIDAFVIGDGEEVIGEIIDVYKKFKMKNAKFKINEDLLKALSELEGIYVPAVHANNQKIKRRIVKNLDDAPFPESPLVPLAPVIHDRVAIEISRGCTKGCRFCQAGIIYRPLRERSLEKLLSLSQKSILNTGYEEISFISLSTGDYSGLLPLIKTFNNLCSGSHIAISLPSLRVGSVSAGVLKEIKSVRKTGFTIAPEAGTERLRIVINKDFTMEEYEETLTKLFIEGWQGIKLYFMLGLPTETQSDVEGIINMVEMASRKGREIMGKRVNINVGISAFVPKPHTPFQWFGQMPYEELRARQDFLRKALKKRGFNFKGQHIESSLLEAVFSRGDENTARLLETAWRLGCCFDGWSEVFDFNRWLMASEKTGIDLYKCASWTFDIESELPWEFIDTGVKKEFLKSEYQRALKGEVTSDCRRVCYGCGLECKDSSQKTKNDIHVSEVGLLITDNRQLSPILTPTTHHGSTELAEVLSTIKIRVKFSKTGLMRYLSHREVITAFLRAIRRANIPLLYSEGFHPHPKVSFGPALPVGVEGLNEYLDIELPAGRINLNEFIYRINASLPQGLRILAAVPVNKNKKSLNELISYYEYKITIDKALIKPINSFMSLSSCLITRGGKTVDIRPMVERAEINNKYLNLILRDINGIKVRLYEILKEMFQKPIEELQAIPVKRPHLYGFSEKGLIEPLNDREEK